MPFRVFKMLRPSCQRSLFRSATLLGLAYVNTMATNYEFLAQTKGYKGQRTDLLVFRPSTPAPTHGIVYYFGGDIQVESTPVITEIIS